MSPIRARFQWTLIALAVLATCSCASIVKGTQERVEFESTPPGATVTIAKEGETAVLYTGTTPFSSKLDRGKGYFKKAVYDVQFTRDGYEPVDLKLRGKANGWYMFGNILFGGLIGWLVVDPASGGMYTMSKEPVHVALQQVGSSGS